MPVALRLTDVQHELVADYRSALEAAGMSTHPVRLWPAKAFCSQVGSPEAWSRLSLDEQCTLHPRLRSFVGWLMVSGRLAATPEYLVVGQPKLGRIAQAHHAPLHAVFTTTAHELGYSHSVIEDQWSLLVRVAAMNRQAPDAVSRGQLQAACGAIEQAEARYAPGRVRGRASVAKFRGGLEAVLFHAGLIDETPALREYSHRMWMRHESAVARAIAGEIGAPEDDVRCAALAHFALEARALIYGRRDRRQAAQEIFALLERGWTAVTPSS